MENYVITVARGYGSGGRTIAQMLAKELGIPFYDRDILQLASDDSGISADLFAANEEKQKKRGLKLFSKKKNVYEGDMITPDSSDFTSTDNLFNYEAKIIKDLSKKESCVIVGRCADYVLKDEKNVLRVYIHAPLQHCIEVVAPMKNMSEKEAAKFIKKTDKERAGYYYYHTGNRWNDAGNYDLCLNTESLSYETCVSLIKNFMKIYFECV